MKKIILLILLISLSSADSELDKKIKDGYFHLSKEITGEMLKSLLSDDKPQRQEKRVEVINFIHTNKFLLSKQIYMGKGKCFDEFMVIVDNIYTLKPDPKDILHNNHHKIFTKSTTQMKDTEIWDNMKILILEVPKFMIEK